MRGRSLLIALCSVCAASAQTDRVMHEVSITAARRLSETGIQRTTLDTTVLHQNVALSMSDILTLHSPLFIKSYGRATESTAEFRGTSPSHTQVLWNGLKINSPTLGTVDFSTIPAYCIDEASLLHGASSLTQTGGGLGGAVLLTTLPVREQGVEAQYIQGYGSFETYDQFLRLTYAGRQWSGSTRVVYARSENNFPYTNYDKKVDVRDDDGRIVSSYHPTERNKSGYFRDLHVLQDLFYDTESHGRLGATVWYTRSLRGLPFLSVDYRDDRDFTNEQQQQALRSVVSWQHMPSALWHLNARAGFAYQGVDYDYSSTASGISTTITSSRSYSRQAYLQAYADYMPTADWLLTAHLDLTYSHVSSRDFSPFHIGDNYDKGRTENALSLTARWRPNRQLALSAVLREEAYRHDLVPLIPALFGEIKLLPSLVFKCSVARNYRYPTMDDLYFRPGGNPDLRPERGFTYDGGLEFTGRQGASRLHANLSAFNSYITDWILWTPNAKGYWQPSNLKKVHNYGAECTVDAHWQMNRRWSLDAMGSYAYTPSLNRSEDLDESDTSYGKQLVYVPRHSANVSASLHYQTWALTYQWHSYSERFTTTSNEVSRITGRLKPYYMSNLTLERRFHSARLNGAVKGVVYNLLDSEYVTVLSRPMAGRHFEIFLEIKPQWKPKRKS